MGKVDSMQEQMGDVSREMEILINNQKKCWRLKKQKTGTSLAVQWLRLCTPNAGGPGSISGQGTRSCMPQLRSPHAATKSSRASTKTWCSQVIYFLNKN